MVSTSRGNEKNTCSEMWYLLGEVGDRGSNIETTPVIGLVVAKTKLDPIKAIQGLRELFRQRPWEFKYTLKIVPIQRVLPAQISEIQNGAVTIASEIAQNEKFRITIEKRHTGLSSKAIIDTVAKKIDRVVELETPDKILLIEIIGELAGLAVITPTDILSVEREKRIG
ncbi:MAG: THUMP domain-containing protein [Candidatus Bathyarchaeia archaeon]|jgi:tRNA acetyltransferase TAN1